MSWKIRRHGAVQLVEGLTLAQVVEGLHDGYWDPVDEVMGPQDQEWVRIEDHPQLEDVAVELGPISHLSEDEARLDMNAMIDVTQVLLVFFILTVTYSAQQMILESPDMTIKGPGAIRVTPQQVEEKMIHVEVRQENDKPVFRIEKEEVDRERLFPVLKRFAGQTNKTELLLEHDFDAPHGAVVAVQDAAKGAGILKVHILVKPEDLQSA